MPGNKPKVIDAEKGVYELTESTTEKKEFSLKHIRKIKADLEARKAEQCAEIDKDIAIWDERENAIKALPDFVEPTVDPDAEPEPEPEPTPRERIP